MPFAYAPDVDYAIDFRRLRYAARHARADADAAHIDFLPPPICRICYADTLMLLTF